MTGIYFLIYRKRIVYVGETECLEKRLPGHYDKKYTSVRFIPCAKDKMLEYESRWIKRFNPKYNKTIGRQPKHAFNSLKVGEKAQLKGSAAVYPHQFKAQYEKKDGRKLLIIKQGNKIFAERIA